MVERNIQAIKKTLKKAIKTNQDPYMALLALHTTPLKNGSSSPAKQLMIRTLRTNLPNITSNKYKKTQELPIIRPNDVRIKFNNNWFRKGKIIRKTSPTLFLSNPH